MPQFILFFLKENNLFILKVENGPHFVDAPMDYFKLKAIRGES